MKIEQIYTGCLAQGAYYIESNGESVIIDPLREVTPYLEKAGKNGASIKYILETHFHADFVSGHLDLQKATGAPIVYGPNANPAFDAYLAKDGEVFSVGKIKIKVLHTPGHTLESTCYLLQNEAGKDVALFTGDTLFIGDVGRPDLAQKSSLSVTDLAGFLYDSLRTKILPLANDVIVYPAHGAGSACGKNMARETSDTLGHQKETNYALRTANKADFIREVTDGLEPPPKYFPENVRMNREGYDSIGDVLERGCRPLPADAFEKSANETNALILDTRDPEVFAKGFIPNSINIGIDGTFAPWVGALIPDIKQPILLVAEEGREEEIVTRLARVGYDYTIGYLAGGFSTWQTAGKEMDSIPSIDAYEFAEAKKQNPEIPIVDVRKPAEYQAESIRGAENAPLDFINDVMPHVRKEQSGFVHCAGGYRSMIFISILKARGYDNLINVKGGFSEIKKSGLFPLTNQTS